MRRAVRRRELEHVVGGRAGEVLREAPRPRARRRSVPPKCFADQPWDAPTPYIAAPSVATVTMASSRAELQRLRGLDRRQDVADAREPEVGQRREHRVGHAAGAQQVARPAASLKSTTSWSVLRSDTAIATSVFITLWISGMCLSPMPWMLCSPKPL